MDRIHELFQVTPEQVDEVEGTTDSSLPLTVKDDGLNSWMLSITVLVVAVMLGLVLMLLVSSTDHQ